MSKLPAIPYNTGLQKLTQVQFGGLRHNDNCQSGEIYDMWNLASEHQPYLGTREARGTVSAAPDYCLRMYADEDSFLWITEDGLWYENRNNGFMVRLRYLELDEAQKSYFVKFGDRVILMPRKQIINVKYPIIGVGGDIVPEATQTGQAFIQAVDDRWLIWVWNGAEWQFAWSYAVTDIDMSVEVENVIVMNGTIFEEPATANTILLPVDSDTVQTKWGLAEGDAVTISGMSYTVNNRTAVLREILAKPEGMTELHFSDNIFYIPDEAESYEEKKIKLERLMPEMDFLFEHGNRLWGAKGEEVFASKVGDPRNWNVFDGLATDSWHLQTQQGNKITGGCSFLYPRFFREKGMITVYGSIPSGFQTQEQDMPGVKEGENRSLCQCGGLLSYLSPQGIVLFDGDGAYIQDQVFGGWEISGVIGASDGQKLYLYADLGKHPEADGERMRAILVYDSQKGMWTKEMTRPTNDLWYAGGLVMMLVRMNEQGEVIDLAGGIRQASENSVYGMVEFGDFTADNPDRKGLQKLQIRLELGEGAYLNVWASHDGGDWRMVGSVSTMSKKSINLPVILRRCDHFRIKIEGTGPWKIYSMSRKIYIGSDKH